MVQRTSLFPNSRLLRSMLSRFSTEPSLNTFFLEYEKFFAGRNDVDAKIYVDNLVRLMYEHITDKNSFEFVGRNVLTITRYVTYEFRPSFVESVSRLYQRAPEFGLHIEEGVAPSTLLSQVDVVAEIMESDGATVVVSATEEPVDDVIDFNPDDVMMAPEFDVEQAREEERKEFMSMKIPVLRQYAKDNDINLRGERSKGKIVDIIMEHHDGLVFEM